MPNEFQHGLFGCFDNCGVCIITYFIPCYTHGRVAEKVGEDCLMCGLTQLIPLANLFFGAQIRGKVSQPGAFIEHLTDNRRLKSSCVHSLQEVKDIKILTILCSIHSAVYIYIYIDFIHRRGRQNNKEDHERRQINKTLQTDHQTNN